MKKGRKSEKTLFKCFFIFLTLVAVLTSGCGMAAADARKALNYPRGYTFKEIPHPLSDKNPRYPLSPRAIPVCGKPFHDARFGTVMTRVTQKEGVRHEYSRFDSFNVDQSMIILFFPLAGEWRVYRTKSMPYKKKGNLVRTLKLEEPRWDPKNPNLVWGVRGFKVLKINIKTGETIVVKDFSKDSKLGPIIKKERDLYRITMKDEGESSVDKWFWAFALQGTSCNYRLRYIFTWDRKKNQISGLYKISPRQSDIDWIGMSYKGKWVLIGGQPENSGNFAGLVMANKELTRFHRLDYATAHADVGLDSKGNEVVVMQNVRTDYIDLIPISLKTKPILEKGGGYKNTNRVRLVRLYYNSESPLSLNSGVHISCNFRGYAVVSTYIEPGLLEQNWLDRTIILVKLDRKHPRAFYLAKVYNTTKEYWEETHATITSGGSKVIWASNWNKNVGKEKVFLLQLGMPNNWSNSPQMKSK